MFFQPFDFKMVSNLNKEKEPILIKISLDIIENFLKQNGYSEYLQCINKFLNAPVTIKLQGQAIEVANNDLKPFFLDKINKYIDMRI